MHEAFHLISISDLKLIEGIRERGGEKQYDYIREWGGNAAVVLGDSVAMEIRGEAIRNVQIVLEQ